ncbi:MAG: 50S ribosomal protein L21 [Candidatus Hydrogenedentota bacterium]
MYAVIKTGGKQYKVSPGDNIFVERIDGKEGDVVEINEVLLIKDDKGVKVGNPFIQNTKVLAKIVEQKKDDKIIIFKYKRRTKYRRKRGHRQNYTKLVIDKISIE